jgi:hypothetical protein
MNIQDIRQKYPQYNDLPDKELVDGLHSKFYSDIPVNDFYQKVGFQAAPLVPPQEPNKEILGGIPRQIADVPLKVGAGAVTGVRLIADAFGADNPVSQNLRGVENWIADLYSAQSKKDSQEIARIMKDAEDKGVADQVLAGVKAFSVAPVDLLANALGTSAPAILAALGTTLTGGAPLVAGAATLGTGAAMGAGTIKGSIYDATKQILSEKTQLTPEQIEKAAVQAQAYNGKNLDQILLGAGLGAVGGASGAEPVIARQLAKGIASTAAQKEAVKLATEKAAVEAAKRGVIKHGAITAGKEFLGEAAEGGQEQMAQNLAQQRLGFDVPTMQGVAGQATMEGLAGLGMGAVSGGREALGAKREQIAKELAAAGPNTGENIGKDLFTKAGTKASAQTISDEELEKQFNASPSATAGDNPLEVLANSFVSKFPVGQEGNIATGKAGGEFTVNKLLKLIKDLGIELPKSKPGKTRIDAMAALRNYMDNKNAADELTDIPDLNGTANVDETTEAKQTTPQGQKSSTAPITWDTMQPGQQVTLYRGENKENVAGGQWWTTDPAKAAKFGTVTNVTLPAEVIAQHAAKGHGGLNEFVFPTEGKRPSDLVQTPPVTPPPPPPSAPVKPMMPATQKFYDAELTKYNANPNDTKSLQTINSLEKKHGMPLTTAPQGRVLSAKKTAQQELQELKKIRPSETTAYEYDPDLSPELNQEIANGIAQNEEKEQAAHKAKLTEMSDKADVGKYEVSEEDKALYLEQKAEHDAKAREANDKRNAALPVLEKARQIANNLYREATKRANAAITAVEAYKKSKGIKEDVEAADYATTRRLKKTDSELLRLTDAASRALEEESNLHEKLIAAESALTQLGPEINDMPRWQDLSASDKDVYFGSITAGPVVNGKLTFGSGKQEHRKAARALMEHRSKLNGMDNAEQRVSNAYTETRTLLGKEYKTKFPEWKDLSDHAKEIFREGLTNLSGLQLDRSFGNLAQYLNEQNKAISEQEKLRIGQEIQDRLNRIAEQTKVDTKKREEATKGWRPKIDPETGEIERDPYTNERIPARFGSGEERVSKNTLNDYDKLKSYIADGDLSGALGHISQMKSVSPFNRIIAKAVRSMLQGMKSPPLLVLVNKLSNNDLGQYDPSHVSEGKIGKISIRSAQPEILLHEAIHAVTIQVLHTYFEGNRDSLTAAQKAGAEQLLKIMVLTKKVLGERFPNAYEDIYEFVSYALTDSSFKDALADMNLPGTSKINYLVGITAQEAMPQNLRDMPGLKGQLRRTQFIKQFNESKQRVTNVSNISTKPESAWTAFKLSIADLITAGYKAVKQVINGEETETENEEENEAIRASGQRAEVERISLKGLLFRGSTGSENQNFLMEIAAAFEDIMAPQTGAIALEDLSAKKTPTPSNPPIKAPPREGGMEKKESRKAYKTTEKETGKSGNGGVFKKLFSTAGWRNIARVAVDKTYEARSLWARQDLGGKIIRDMTKAFNNFTEHMDTSTSVIQNYVTHYLSKPLGDLKVAFQEYTNAFRDGDTDEAFIDFHMLAEMFSEDERRTVKWVTTVPFSTEKTGPKAVTFLGKQMGAADVRTAILGDPSTGASGIIHKYKLTDAQKQNFWSLLTGLANTHADYSGYSPRGLTFSADNKKAGVGLKKEDDIYNVLGIDKGEVAIRRQEYGAMPQERKDAIQKIFASVKELTDATKELNQIGNYWSTPVDNLLGMYNYQHYVPFKGLSKFNETKEPHVMDKMIDPSRMTEGKSKTLVDTEYATSGRMSVSDNPLLQVMYDSFRAAHRAGVVKATEALKNSAKYDKVKNPNGTGIINAEVVDNIKFPERETSKLQQYKGSSNTVFHYNEDGSIDVIRILEPKLASAIRYSYKKNNILLDAANNITSFFGSMHTRYNLNFAPKNFVVDLLTNAWNIGGGKLGPAHSLIYVKDIASSVLRNGLGKAMEVAHLFDKTDAASQKQLLALVNKDPFAKDMVEMLRFGGRAAYIESMNLKANYEKLSEIKRNKILAKKDQVDALLDTWNNMFEFTSRTAAYSMFKEKMYAANKAAGMSDQKGPNNEMSPAEEAAAVQAAAETLNLANFQKVGDYGRELGAAYMFFRPSAMGAARAIETVAPAFMTEDMMKRSMPGNIQDDPVAAAKYIANYKKLRTNAQVMTGALMGMGYVAYLMSMMMAPDDEWKRNSVRSDDMQQWTKFARFHIPDAVSKLIFGKDSKDVVLQMPWGYGLGAFAAIGAQIGGMMHGQTSLGQGLGNIGMSILSDSFLPIPVSRIPPTDSPLKWAIDSVTPSTLRPLFEYLMNTNGIGQAINSANTRKYGEAFTGGDKIPELYKDASRSVYTSTQGAWDMSPNTMYFFANSYMDGISRIGESSYSWVNLTKGEKIFNPKSDIPLLGSFFGSKSNVDSREFTSVETKVKDLGQRIKTLEDKDPVAFAKFTANNPMADAAVGLYHSEIANINRLRAEANEIRGAGYSPKLREQLLRINILQQNMAKHQFISTIKAYGVAP